MYEYPVAQHQLREVDPLTALALFLGSFGAIVLATNLIGLGVQKVIEWGRSRGVTDPVEAVEGAVADGVITQNQANKILEPS